MAESKSAALPLGYAPTEELHSLCKCAGASKCSGHGLSTTELGFNLGFTRKRTADAHKKDAINPLKYKATPRYLPNV